ncbi:hypothetical protein [Moorena bouillonii]|uniref:hypothetical protein n=1 Tax=Moorena bouillonii TaxID=207920 RepID=UPI0018E96047|nr:hypothetical protein [Moorena bouillonii]
MPVSFSGEQDAHPTGIVVEQASWWNGHCGGTGIVVEQASWWNGHLARFIFRASN